MKLGRSFMGRPLLLGMQKAAPQRERPLKLVEFLERAVKSLAFRYMTGWKGPERVDWLEHPLHLLLSLLPDARQAAGQGDRLDHAAFVGNALAGDVKGGAMVDGSPDDRQAGGHVDAV